MAEGYRIWLDRISTSYGTQPGGAFSLGDKSEIASSPMIAHWLSRGYLVASINYRLAPEYTFPAQVEDVKCAVRFLRENALKYGINPDKIGACGVSAGGYLVGMMGLCDAGAAFDNSGGYLNQSSRLQAVVDLYGPSDFTLQFDGPNGAHSKFLGGADKFYEIAPKANTINYVSSDDPPFLIMHGDKDTTVIPQQSEVLYNKLVAAKVPATLVWVKNAGHGFVPVGQEPVTPTAIERNTIIADFFDKYLK
jgi:acetyl esterase/lipase